MGLSPESIAHGRAVDPAAPWREKLDFLRGLLTDPAGVSAIAPSSAKLAAALAAEIDEPERARVLELGPGTGAVTRAMIAQGVAPSRIVAVEHDPRFADSLRQRIPGLRVMRGDALRLTQTLGPAQADFTAVMSGLPLINLSPATRRAVIGDALSRVPAGAPFIQVSYRATPALPSARDISVTRAAFVWQNLPPAHVWVYRRTV
jgi:phosphatidylethanolamine/phosphatidyl-N-methylethanolamine N-methyltransferase